MQQIEALRKRLSPRGQWFQLGLISATVVTPMISRWKELRAAERAVALREEANARLQEVRSRVPWLGAEDGKRPAMAAPRRPNVSSKLWLVGAGVGLVAAGTVAYFLVRRRMTQAVEEPLVDLPTARMNGSSARGREAARDLLATGVTREGAHVGAQGTPQAAAGLEPSTALSEGPEPEELEGKGGGTTVTESGAPAGVVEASAAPFIGNIRTMVYHEAGDEHLPAEENRIYFASEEEALQAGYHRNRDEIPSGETESRASEPGEMGA